jgi:hypothetical protein
MALENSLSLAFQLGQKNEPFCPCCTDNLGKLFATKTISYKWQHRRI